MALKLAALVALVSAATGQGADVDAGPAYKDADRPIAERVASLLSRMTLGEKINQTLNDYAFGAFGPGLPSDNASQRAIASEGMRYLFKFCTGNVSECVRTRNHYQRVAMEDTRLGIPISFSEETLHGSMYAPQYPNPIGLGSSWNESLVTAIFRETAQQAAAVGINVGLSPVINMFPDPRFGRLEEGFSEDPYITSQLGVAAVVGLQGDGTDPAAYLPRDKLSAVVKHYLAYGVSGHGGIDGGPAILDEQTLRERYLRPWEQLAKKGLLRGVMASQSAVNHMPMHCHRRLLTDVLRDELNCSNVFIHSDGGCVIGTIQNTYSMAATQGEAASLAISAGVDMDFAGCSYSQLAPEVQSGRVSMQDLDRAVSNILRVKFATGMFDDHERAVVPDATEADLNTAEYRQTALDAAEQSIVLLINKNSSLPLQQPLPPSSKPSILLAGPLIDDAASQNGGYSHQAPLSVTFKAALEAAAGASGPFSSVTSMLGTTHGTSGPGSVTASDSSAIDATVAAAAQADVAVLVLGDDLKTCAEMGDRAGLDLLGGQPELLRRVSAAAKRTIVFLVTGRPVSFETGMCVAAKKNDGAAFPWDPNARVGAACLRGSLLTNVSALLMAWRPGYAGGTAALNILTGRANPSARLSVSWPRSVGGVGAQTPYLQQHSLHFSESYQGQPNTPLFPFGYGLSFSQFVSGSPVIAGSSTVSSSDTVTLQVPLQNKGVAGCTVLQVYYMQTVAPVVRYTQQLVRFKRLCLGKSEATTVNITLTPMDMAFYDANPKKPAAPGWSLGLGGRRNSTAFVLSAGLNSAETKAVTLTVTL